MSVPCLVVPPIPCPSLSPASGQLWGKLETLGLGTAIKIMFFSDDEEGKRELNSLNRNELIALVNTAAQLAKSVGSVPGWRWLGEGKGLGWREEERRRRMLRAAAACEALHRVVLPLVCAGGKGWGHGRGVRSARVGEATRGSCVHVLRPPSRLG